MKTLPEPIVISPLELLKLTSVDTIDLTDNQPTKNETMKKLPIDKIKQACAKVIGVSVAEIESRNRFKLPALARQFAMYYALRGRTLEGVGRAFDRNHRNVFHARDKIAFLRDTDWEIKHYSEQIEQALAS